MTDWATLAAWAGVVLVVVGVVVGVVSRSQGREQARTDKAVDELRRAFDRAVDELRKDARTESRLIDEHMKATELRSLQAGVEQTIALQRAIDSIVPRLQDQISATSERVARLEEWRRAFPQWEPRND